MTAISAMSASKLAMHKRRKRVNNVGLALAFGAMAFGVFWLVWILFETIRLGGGGLNLALFTESTPAAMSDGGGLANALYGSIVMVLVATLIGTPIGIFSGVYLAEYGSRSRLAAVTRFINDVLLSAPSLVIGLFVYELIVVPAGGASGWAGSVALALIVIPVVIRTTENMLNLVPHSLREAAYALGTPKWKVISTVTLKAASAGVVTGILLAVALHRAVEPVLQLESRQADGQRAGRHLQLRELRVSEPAANRVGRRVPDHAGRARTERRGTRVFPQQELRASSWTPRSTCRSTRKPSFRSAT